MKVVLTAGIYFSLLIVCYCQSKVNIIHDDNNEVIDNVVVDPNVEANDLQTSLTNIVNETRNKFNEALLNLSHYLPVSVDYAVNVGHNCNIIEYNRAYYGPPGLIISALIFIIGVLFCIVGYRLIKLNLFLIGFVIGGLLTYFVILAFIGNFTPSWKIYVTIIITVIVAMISGLITICIYYIGMFLAGAAVGFLGSWFILSAIDIAFFQTHIYIPLLIALAIGIACGILTLIFQKWLVIVGTSIIGAFFIMLSLDYYLELGQMIYFLFLFAVHRSALVLCWYSWVLLALFPILAVVGFILQALVTGRKYDHKKDFENGICCGLCKKCCKKKKKDGDYMPLKNVE